MSKEQYLKILTDSFAEQGISDNLGAQIRYFDEYELELKATSDGKTSLDPKFKAVADEYFMDQIVLQTADLDPDEVLLQGGLPSTHPDKKTFHPLFSDETVKREVTKLQGIEDRLISAGWNPNTGLFYTQSNSNRANTYMSLSN